MKYLERLRAWGEPPTLGEVSDALSIEEGRSAREVREIINKNRRSHGKISYGDTLLHSLCHPLQGGIRKKLFHMEELGEARYGTRRVETRIGIEQVFRLIKNP